MAIYYLASWEWIALIQNELLLFAVIFFLIGAIDDFAVDIYWFCLRLTGRANTSKIDAAQWSMAPLSGNAAVFIPAWNESSVIGDTVAHTLAAWPQQNVRLYIGCYRNDAKTIAAVMRASGSDQRLRLVIHDRAGPSTKADCLNRLYRALEHEEARYGTRARMVVFHDAEDMVDPAGLALLDDAISRADFAQLPVLPIPQQHSRWIGSHYCEEFAEAHGKGMVVREAIGAALPGAGVGCAIERGALDRLAKKRGKDGPFSTNSLTEDYELGINLAQFGAKWAFVRRRHGNDELVATRAYFPGRLDHIVRQKTRWVHGIAFQGWDRLGWTSGGDVKLAELWMRLRDRRGPLSALVMLAGYILLALSAMGWTASMMGAGETMPLTPLMQILLSVSFAAFVWRGAMRFAFTAREYGAAEGMRAILRVPIANVIAIMAGRRALFAYVRVLLGSAVEWDKTPHFSHPARAAQGKREAQIADQSDGILDDEPVFGFGVGEKFNQFQRMERGQNYDLDKRT